MPNKRLTTASKTIPSGSSPWNAKQLFVSPDTFGTTLLTLAIDAFPADTEEEAPGSPVFRWHPTTLRMELEQEFNAVLTPENSNKLSAVIAILNTDLFFQQVFHFNQFCTVLSSHGLDHVFEPASVEDCMWGVTEAFLHRPPDDEEPEPFSQEVRRYLGKILHEDGYLKPPGILQIALEADHRQRVAADYFEHPDLWNEIQAGQDQKTQAVEQALQDRLRLLFEQLKSLPLVNGDTSLP